MNPEEGELRPQLLDRFGLAVDVAASTRPETRVEIIRRRLAFEDAPHAMVAEWEGDDFRIAERIDRARRLVREVVLPDAVLNHIAWLCSRIEVDGMRADLVISRTTVAHAAWEGRRRVLDADIDVAARLAPVSYTHLTLPTILRV